MAVLKTEICSKCCKQYSAVISHGFSRSTLCHDCENAKEIEERKKYFDKLDSLSLEERIRIIEEWIYNKRKERPHSDMIF